MDQFEGRIAVVTGGGTGIGRELVRQLSAAGAHVSMCDVSAENMAESKALAEKEAPAGTRITTFVADVSDEAAMLAFRDHVLAEQQTDHVNLVFNNAGIGGGASFVTGPREEWDRTFDVCWKGVYNGCRAFVPLLVASDAGHLVNVSSVNGFWASLGPDRAHTAYSAAKFAVKGFTEALVNDFRLNAPHVGVSVVMPGHIGTSIVINSAQILGHRPEDMTADDLAETRKMMEGRGLDASAFTDDQIRGLITSMGEMFRDNAPTSAEQAAGIILDGVRDGRWRILVGDDAVILDQLVREAPEDAYEASFSDRQRAAGGVGIEL
ncbi:SDR family NAD(P)-dependent oxidoreductase [Actinospongicola halichondriae]|uniref:SDR family NAD(P)-dependent oxidoreductase n=1 Tax=Actinospongicola halichondriae TaxID=3236844 RepID=UPI003D40C0A5